MSVVSYSRKVNNVDYKTGDAKCVPRNCAELNDRWMSVARTIDDRWAETCGTPETRRPFMDIVREVLADPKTNNGLDSKEFRQLAMGCGCCPRHSAGIFLGTAPHVSSHSPVVPGEPPCGCNCRQLARKMCLV
jgi:hypothetical protein